MLRIRRVGVLALFAVTAVAARELPSGFRLEPIFGGLSRPSAIASTRDGRLLITERTTGTVRVAIGGELQAAPLCTIPVDPTGEGGLLGITVHPNFAVNGWIYLYYTDLTTGNNQVRRYVVGGGSCTASILVLADLGAGGAVLRNGGGLAFGNDGKLYVATGDVQVPANSQDLGVLEGKILRLNDDGSIPSTNPSPTSAVFARGVRDGRGLAIGPAGQIYASDRGSDVESAHDELNRVTGGADLGWPATTGTGLAAWLPTIGVHGVAFGADGLPNETADARDSDHDRFGDDGLPGKARVDDNATGECVGSVNRGATCSSNADCPPRPPSEFAYCEFRDDSAEYCPGGSPIYDDACGAATGAGVDEPDESYRTSLYTTAGGELRRAVLTGAGLDTLSAWRTFLNSSPANPTAPPPPITDCPTDWTGIMTGADGWLYALATNGGGAGAGALYRVTHRGAPGPREVSPPGSPFYLRIAKGSSSSELLVSWEDLRDDAKQPRNSGTTILAPEREYTIWRGTIGSWTSHVPLISATPGAPTNDAMRRESISTPAGTNEYFLVSGRGDNLEGSLGKASTGVERIGYPVTDLCQSLGYYQSPGGPLFSCGKNFSLLDEFGLSESLYERRGEVIMFDLSAIWCGPCQSQANFMENLYQDFKDRDVSLLTVLMDEDSQTQTYEGRPTPAECRNWSDRPTAPDHTFTCMVEPNGPPKVAWTSYNVSFALPTNVILDNGLRVVYAAAGYNETAIRQALDALVGPGDSCLH